MVWANVKDFPLFIASNMVDTAGYTRNSMHTVKMLNLNWGHLNVCNQDSLIKLLVITYLMFDSLTWRLLSGFSDKGSKEFFTLIPLWLDKFAARFLILQVQVQFVSVITLYSSSVNVILIIRFLIKVSPLFLVEAVISYLWLLWASKCLPFFSVMHKIYLFMNNI